MYADRLYMLLLRRSRTTGPGQPGPVEDRRGRAGARQPVQALKGVDKGAHRADAPAAIHAVTRVAVETAPGPRAQLSLDVVRQVPLRPLVITGTAGHAHHLSPSRLRAGTAVVTVVDHP